MEHEKMDKEQAVAAAEDKLLYLLQGCETDRKIGAAESAATSTPT